MRIINTTKCAVRQSTNLSTPDPINGTWITVRGVTNSEKIIFSGLERGKDYYFKLMAVGPLGDSDWSDVATIMVQ